MGERMYRSGFLDIGTRWRRVVNLTALPLYPWRENLQFHWIGDWVGPRTGLDDTQK
jgi:hypothetical protein